jgi:hypothetical protein
MIDAFSHGEAGMHAKRRAPVPERDRSGEQHRPSHRAEPPAAKVDASDPITVSADGEEIEIRAKRRIVLSCGKASITLTASGKVLISGEFVSSQATGVNRIMGGSVRLN